MKIRNILLTLLFFTGLACLNALGMNNNNNDRNLKITLVTGPPTRTGKNVVDILRLLNRYNGCICGYDLQRRPFVGQGERAFQNYLDRIRNTEDYKYPIIDGAEGGLAILDNSLRLNQNEKIHLILVSNADLADMIPERLRRFVTNHIHTTSRIKCSQEVVRELLNEMFSYKHDFYKTDVVGKILNYDPRRIRLSYDRKKIKEDPFDFVLKQERKKNNEQYFEKTLLDLIMFAKSTGNKKLLRKIVNFLRMPKYLGKLKTDNGDTLPTEMVAKIMQFFDFDSAYDRQVSCDTNYDFLIMPMILGGILLSALLLK